MQFTTKLLLLTILLTGCVSIPSDFKDPGVSLKSITPRIAGGITPEFDIVLRVTNPNRVALEVKGLTYTLHLRGNKIIDGIANNIPEIAAYGEADVSLNARTDLFGGIALLADFLNSPGAPVSYEFNAEVDVGTFYPMVKVQKSGELSFP
jgi:LEA14-like dessication related protein